VSNRASSKKRDRLDARAQALQRQGEVDRRNRNIIFAVVALAVIAILGLVFVLPNLGKQTPAPDGGPASLGVALLDEGNAHMPSCPVPPSPGPSGVPGSLQPSSALTANPIYLHHPPSSGCHYPVPALWNVYDVSAPVPEPTFVHNLEHGGIVLIYRCRGTACQDDFRFSQTVQAALPQESQAHEVKFVATPDQDSPVQYAVLAWARELDLNALDDQAAGQIKQFYNLYVDKGGKECQPQCPR